MAVKKTTLGSKAGSGAPNVRMGVNYKNAKKESYAHGGKHSGREGGSHSYESQSKALKLHSKNKPKLAEGY